MLKAREEDVKFKRRMKEGNSCCTERRRKINTFVCQQSVKSQTTTTIREQAWLRHGSKPSCGAGKERE